MNETPLISLRDLTGSAQGWGRRQGREVYQGLLDFVERHPGKRTFQVSLKGIERADVSFASETVVELARRFRGKKGFCLVDLDDPDMLENWDAAAARKEQPLMVSNGLGERVLGPQPTTGTLQAFDYVLDRGSVRASQFASDKGMTVQNASMKLKKLWEQGFLLRRENLADSGGVEYVYFPIR